MPAVVFFARQLYSVGRHDHMPPYVAQASWAVRRGGVLPPARFTMAFPLNGGAPQGARSDSLRRVVTPPYILCIEQP